MNVAAPVEAAPPPTDAHHGHHKDKKEHVCAMTRGLPCDCLAHGQTCKCGEEKILITPYTGAAVATAVGMGMCVVEYLALLKK